MGRILLCILVTIYSSAFAQTNDFCSTTRNIIEAATGNFRKYIVRGTGNYFEPGHSDRWSSPFAYANDIGSKAYICEHRATKQRYFSQIVTSYTSADFLAGQISACLASDPPGHWETKRYDGFSTRFINSRIGVEIRIYSDNKGTKISIYKARPMPPMERSRNLMPYLLNTGEPDYILVDSATMIPLNNMGYKLYGNLYYSADSLLIYQFYTLKNELAYGFLKTNGNSDIFFPVITESANGIDFKEGMAWIKKNGLWYFIDKKGNQIIPPTYQELYTEFFIEGMCAVMKNSKWGYVDKTGRLVIPLIYESASFFYNGLARVKKKDKWGLINKEGKEIILPVYDSISHGFEGGFCRIQKNGKWGFIDKTGKEVIAPQYDLIPADFRGNLCAVKKNNNWDVIDTTGKVVVPFRYREQIYVFNEMAIFSLNKLFGLLDKTGRQIIPPRYNRMMEFTEGLGLVQRNGKWGFIDRMGKEVIPVKYQYADAFENGLARVTLNNKSGFIDKTGKPVIPLAFDGINYFKEGFAAVTQNSKWGFIDKTGKVTIPLIYNGAQDFKYGKALVRNEDGVLFFIDRAGREYREK